MQLSDWLQRAEAAVKAAQEVAQHNHGNMWGRLNGHVTIRPLFRPFTGFDETAARLKAVPGVKQVLAAAEGQAMASSQSASASIIVRGLRADDLKALPAISGNVRFGTLEGFDEAEGIAIGTHLADTLHVAVGSEIAMDGPLISTAAGHLPSQKRFRVNAIFDLGVLGYGAPLVFMPLKEAQSFLNLRGAVHALQLFVDNPENIDAMRLGLQAAAGDDMQLTDWRQRMAALAAVKNAE
jgi:lipoprotein-releasing system permease protein